MNCLYLLPQDSLEVIAEMPAESVLVEGVINDGIRGLYVPESRDQQQCSDGAVLPLSLAFRYVLYKQHTITVSNREKKEL